MLADGYGRRQRSAGRIERLPRSDRPGRNAGDYTEDDVMKMKKVVTENAVATDAKATKTAKAKAAPKERAASKFISADVFEGRRMRVSEYQDYTFSINDSKNRRLTDEELAADWRKQFPNAVAFTAFHVTGARRDYNKGIHSKAFPGMHTVEPWFADAAGKRTQTAPAKSATQETPKAPAKGAATTDKAPVAKKARKTVAA